MLKILEVYIECNTWTITRCYSLYRVLLPHLVSVIFYLSGIDLATTLMSFCSVDF